LISENSNSLFQQAILESDPTSLTLKTPDQMGQVQKRFAFYLNCSFDDFDCMRAASVDDVLEAQDYAQNTLNNTNILTLFYPWTPIVDGVTIKEQPVTAFRNGNYQKKPILMGTVLEEGWLFIYAAYPSNMTNPAYETAIYNVFGDHTAAVLALYPPDRVSPPDEVDNRPLISVLATDYVFACSNRWSGFGIAKTNPHPMYVYRFDQVMSFDAWGDANPYCVGHVCHGSEVAYLYHSWGYDNSGFVVTPEEQNLADTMTYYWTNFAKSGNPNLPVPQNPPPDFIQWPAFDESTDQILTMNATFSTVRNYRKLYCDTFDSFGPDPYVNPKDT